MLHLPYWNRLSLQQRQNFLESLLFEPSIPKDCCRWQRGGEKLQEPGCLPRRTSARSRGPCHAAWVRAVRHGGSSALRDAATARQEPRRSAAVWCHLPAQPPGSGPSPAGAPRRAGNSPRGHFFWAETGEVALALRSLTSIASAPSVPTLVTDLK